MLLSATAIGDHSDAGVHLERQPPPPTGAKREGAGKSGVGAAGARAAERRAAVHAEQRGPKKGMAVGFAEAKQREGAGARWRRPTELVLTEVGVARARGAATATGGPRGVV